MRKLIIKILILFFFISNHLFSLNGWSIVDSNKWMWQYKDAICLDSNNCFAVAYYAKSYFVNSTDGGKTWNKIYSDTIFKGKNNEQLEVHTIAYLDKKNIILGCSLGDFISTEDSGKTWQKSSIGIKEQVRVISFISKDSGIVLTDNSLYKTENGGKKWDKVVFQNIGSNIIQHWNLAFPNKNLIIINSELKAKPDVFLISYDFGTSWEIIPNPAGGITVVVYFKDEKIGWLLLIGFKSRFELYDRILKTTDGGRTWSEQLNRFSGVNSLLFDIFFFDDNNGYVSGIDGKLYKTTNSGNDWILLNPYPKIGYEPHFSCVTMPSKNTCLVFTNNGEILRYDGSTLYVNNEISDSFSISPNPAGEYIEIYGLNKGLQPLVSDQDIKIYNLLGECVLSVAQTFPSVDSGQTGMSDLLRVDVSGLPAGVYFVRVGNWVGRFLKI
mgnify:CR=1 FL=1